MLLFCRNTILNLLEMTMRLHLLSITSLCLVLASPIVSASGGGGFNQSGFSQKKIDQQYELGKSYYKSKQSDGSRLEYCIKSGGEFKKLSRRSVRSYKKGPVSKFVDSLYSCKNTSLRIADAVSDEQGTAILYYLNKRYKLRLKDG